jgi:hypothetical protein
MRAPLQRLRARGRTRPKGEMNKLESEYGNYLETLKRVGAIVWYKFEAMKLRLANNTFYTPDFMVMKADGQLEAHETKGFWEDDARVKIKVAASLYPFQFYGITKDKSGWKIEEF